MSIEVRPLRNIGAEIIGLDLSRPINEDIQSVIYRAWLEHGVLLFRGAVTSQEAHLALSHYFGELDEHENPLKALRVGDSKEVIAVEAHGARGMPSYHMNGKLVSAYLFWHQDLCYTPTICKGAVLRMIEMPAVGGETGWIDTIKAYDTLPKATQRKIDGLEVRMRLRTSLSGIPFGLDPDIREASQEEASWELKGIPNVPDVVHPLVSTHPETGRKSLAISPMTLVEILGMERAESDELLRSLVTHTLREDFMLVHRWKVNDVVVWDNRRTIHSAFGHPPDMPRVAHRTTLAPGVPTGRIYAETART